MANISPESDALHTLITGADRLSERFNPTDVHYLIAGDMETGERTAGSMEIFLHHTRAFPSIAGQGPRTVAVYSEIPTDSSRTHRECDEAVFMRKVSTPAESEQASQLAEVRGVLPRFARVVELLARTDQPDTLVCTAKGQPRSAVFIPST